MREKVREFWVGVFWVNIWQLLYNLGYWVERKKLRYPPEKI